MGRKRKRKNRNRELTVGTSILTKRGEVWESLDGGATWAPAGLLPVDLCGGDEQCDVPVQCAPEACVIGHQLTRLGWGGQADEGLGSPSPGDLG